MKNRSKVIVGMISLLVLGGSFSWRQKPYTEAKTKEQQIAYLREHEQELTAYVESQNSKVKSVQWDWDSVEAGTIGNGTPQGGGQYLEIFGNANNARLDNFTLHFHLGDNGLPTINSMITTDLYRFEE